MVRGRTSRRRTPREYLFIWTVIHSINLQNKYKLNIKTVGGGGGYKPALIRIAKAGTNRFPYTSVHGSDASTIEDFAVFLNVTAVYKHNLFERISFLLMK